MEHELKEPIQHLISILEARFWILIVMLFLKDFVNSMLKYIYLSMSNTFSIGGKYEIDSENVKLEKFGLFRLEFVNSSGQTIFIPIAKILKEKIKTNGVKHDK
jgi:small-conductance mechanosensitive channel